MSEPNALPTPAVYQLRLVLRGVSPLIWRRVLVRGDTTIADLHATFQVALGWPDEHLHRFVIHGKAYGVAHLGGISFHDDPRRVWLADLGLRVRERFLYGYDFTDGWQHDVRVERIMPLEPGRCYPVCIGGRRAVPPEGCGGPWAYLKLRQHYSAFAVTRRLAELLGEVLDTASPRCQRCQRAISDVYRDEVAELLRWARADRFDRRAVSRRLRQLGQQTAITAHAR
jgi:Plasmid pRiA4b ORF-3-like protein